MRRITAIALSVLILLGCLCVNVFAEDTPADKLLGTATGEETSYGCCGNVENLLRSDIFDPTDEDQYVEFIVKNKSLESKVLQFHQMWDNYQQPFNFTKLVTKITVKDFIDKLEEVGHDRTTVSIEGYDGALQLKEIKLYDVNPEGGDDILVATADNYKNGYNCYENVEGLIHGDKLDPESETQYLEIHTQGAMKGILTFNWNGNLTTPSAVGDVTKDGEYSVTVSSKALNDDSLQTA